MLNENKEVKPTEIVEIEVKGKKYKVTKAFKDDMDADRSELATKVSTLETDKRTLAQKLNDLEELPTKTKAGGDDDGGDEDVVFADLMDRPQSAIDKAVAKALKKQGLDPAKLTNPSDVNQKVQFALQEEKYWNAFYKEHDYYDEDVHGELIKLKTKQLLPKIQALPLKEGRKMIAEAVADMLGRKITKGKLEISTTSKHEAVPGMQLEGADGGEVDNRENPDDTNRNKGKSGSMAEDLLRRKQARLKAAKG